MSNCIENNNFRIIKGEGFEIKQVSPTKGAVDQYMILLSSMANEADMMKIGLLTKEQETATEERKVEIENKIEKLTSSQASTEETLKKSGEGDAILLISSIEGHIFDTGYFKVKGENIDFDTDIIKKIPADILDVMLKNANDLMNLSKAEEKN